MTLRKPLVNQQLIIVLSPFWCLGATEYWGNTGKDQRVFDQRVFEADQHWSGVGDLSRVGSTPDCRVKTGKRKERSGGGGA